MNVEIRFLKEKDILETTKLIHEFFSLKNLKDGYEKMSQNGMYQSVVAILDEQIIGHILIENRYDIQRDQTFYWLRYICVKKEYQHHGIATKMLKKVEEIAKENHICYICFKSDNFRTIAHACYQKNGYQKVDTTVFQKLI